MGLFRWKKRNEEFYYNIYELKHELDKSKILYLIIIVILILLIIITILYNINTKK